MLLRFNATSLDGKTFFKRLALYHFRLKKNLFIAICGELGSGKSYAGLRIAEMIQERPPINLRHQLIYYPTQFLKAIKTAKEKGYKVLIMDEAHTTMPSRTWYSFVNKAVWMVGTTFRQLHQLALIVITPNINWIERKLREVMNYYIYVERHAITKPIIHFYKIGFNYFDLRDQQPYLKKIMIKYKGKMVILKRIRINLPSERLIKEYEEIAPKYKQKILETQMLNLERRIPKSEREVIEFD